MKNPILAITSAGLILVTGCALAQEEQVEYPPMQVVEGWTCKYLDGKGPEDLAKANAAWNAWMDETDQQDYAAAIITPNLVGEFSFDFAWMGVAKTGTAFGVSSHMWMTQGDEVGRMFQETITCDSHTAWVSMMVDTPDDDEVDADDTDFILSISNCSIKDDHTFEDYMAAAEEWDAYAKEHGIKGVAWVWFPVAGEKNNDYDFKVAGAEDDFIELGENWQKFMDGHWQKSSELFDDVVDCDISRVYTGEMIRNFDDE